MRILLAGGGSGGPVAPLIAVSEQIKKLQPKTHFLLIGSHNGPEENMVRAAGLEFQAITTGKWRRYFSLQNLLAPFLVFYGFFQACSILKSFRPECVFGTGSFVQVPIIWAAWLFRIPCVVHQQDVYPSLANKLCEFFVSRITVSFEKSLTDFSSGLGLFYKKKQPEKVVLIGNPFREELRSKTRAQALGYFNLRPDMPVLLVLGGGTGSEFINKLILQALPELSRVVQIIHSQGNRGLNSPDCKNYFVYNFIDRMDYAYAAADIVLCRAGMSTLTELSNLGKLSIIIPLPDTHQEYNAFLMRQLKSALVFRQSEIYPQTLVRLIRKLLFDANAQKLLTANISKIMPKNSAEKISRILLSEAKKERKYE
ncbi:MAG: UDP-N-acetylglucosamine--N-acetylmuramyl-(pentapeptide) pyrophosphoryl-undecaprenol N-acetylglucosamine transferase [Candidatus Doudnabacteria bacterium]|nr:UDP-N-acetylglucosamine--N-acetylmuramyl-(pentapeptide) pyrophosphoryl-undecaprenol N-acetylglucosamine transferase [Candidatus Doudnabacteria bacterium]